MPSTLKPLSLKWAAAAKVEKWWLWTVISSCVFRSLVTSVTRNTWAMTTESNDDNVEESWHTEPRAVITEPASIRSLLNLRLVIFCSSIASISTITDHCRRICTDILWSCRRSDPCSPWSEKTSLTVTLRWLSKVYGDCWTQIGLSSQLHNGCSLQVVCK